MKKRILAMVLAAVMLLSLTACGGKTDAEKLVGQWRCETNTREVMDMMAQELGEDIMQYVHFRESTLVSCFIFKEDGTYVLYADEAAAQDLVDVMVEDMVDGMSQYLVDYFYQETGMSLTLEEIEEMTGLSIEALVEELGPDQIAADICDSIYSEGKYKAEDGKLHLSIDMNHDIDPNMYETYILDGDNFTITGMVGGEAPEFNMYPMEFVRIG